MPIYLPLRGGPTFAAGDRCEKLQQQEEPLPRWTVHAAPDMPPSLLRRGMVVLLSPAFNLPECLDTGGGSLGWKTTSCACSTSCESFHFVARIFGCFPPPSPAHALRHQSIFCHCRVTRAVVKEKEMLHAGEHHLQRVHRFLGVLDHVVGLPTSFTVFAVVETHAFGRPLPRDGRKSLL